MPTFVFGDVVITGLDKALTKKQIDTILEKHKKWKQTLVEDEEEEEDYNEDNNNNNVI